LGQPQFHCGKPPPAADPSTRINTIASVGARHAIRHPAPRLIEALNAVEVFLVRPDLGVHLDFDEARRFPAHEKPLPRWGYVSSGL
jgi:hypothetical protein